VKFSQCVSIAVLLVGSALAQSSCRPASYEIIKPGKNKKVGEEGGPNSFSPDQKDQNDTAPKPIIGNVPPTAKMEVIWNNKSVVIVKVNSPVTIKPSYDTVDPDDIGVSQCTNPGIVKADYELDSQKVLKAERLNGCETLSVPHVFTRTGEYEISMVVTSNENETAVASMMITVVAENSNMTVEDGGLTISADPMVASKGQVVTFTGSCGLRKSHTITWNFGDGSSATGNIVKHTYNTEGQFRVEATCKDEDGKSIKSVITIVVIGQTIIVPGRPTGDQTVVIPGPINGNPGQKPGQQPGQKPGQQPGQKLGQVPRQQAG
jgi:hypothetical protein